jgi:hypothetical protein
MNPKDAKDVFVSREHRYSLAVDEAGGRCYVSIPVTNGRVDYEEYYEIDRLELDRFLADPSTALAFVERCRRREADDRLAYQPSIERGSPL